ncbi:Aspartyl aminopeptidase [Trichinella papuae]|nr:Aspartyl aminopeptidase [Trichinella papuae]KRZ70604.1 Aspartyl aminopeptidase [Trichinella papuae]
MNGKCCSVSNGYVGEFVKFLNKAVTPYHVINYCRSSFTDANFVELNDGDQWQITPGRSYFVVKNESSVIAFAVGAKFKPGNAVNIVATHTDSPCLKVKPIAAAGYANWKQVAVTTYGGGIWRTWFDRELTIAGRLFIKENESVHMKLFNLENPLLFLPNLAIHLDRDSNSTFTFNAEEHLKPIFTFTPDTTNDKSKMGIIDIIGRRLQISPENIVSSELFLVPVQEATTGGLVGEFIFGARLDNLMSTYNGLTSILSISQDQDWMNSSESISMFAAFDNEECGSMSAQGAMSSWTEWVLRRLQSDAFERSISKSFLISADVAHAIHPNYKSKHDTNHCPEFGKGIVIKLNANQRYATSGASLAKIIRLADITCTPHQFYTNRNDIGCGSTVGPLLASKLAIETVDVGAPLLAMHSAREMGCTFGLICGGTFFKGFFYRMHEVEKEFNNAGNGSTPS